MGGFRGSAIVQIRMPEPGSAPSYTAAYRSRAVSIAAFLELEASRREVDGHFDGDCDFFTICSNVLGMKTVAHSIIVQRHRLAVHGRARRASR